MVSYCPTIHTSTKIGSPSPITLQPPKKKKELAPASSPDAATLTAPSSDVLKEVAELRAEIERLHAVERRHAALQLRVVALETKGDIDVEALETNIKDNLTKGLPQLFKTLLTDELYLEELKEFFAPDGYDGDEESPRPRKKLKPSRQPKPRNSKLQVSLHPSV